MVEEPQTADRWDRMGSGGGSTDGGPVDAEGPKSDDLKHLIVTRRRGHRKTSCLVRKTIILIMNHIRMSSELINKMDALTHMLPLICITKPC